MVAVGFIFVLIGVTVGMFLGAPVNPGRRVKHNLWDYFGMAMFGSGLGMILAGLIIFLWRVLP